MLLQELGSHLGPCLAAVSFLALLPPLLLPGTPGVAPGLLPGQHVFLPESTTFEQQNGKQLARE